MSISADASGVKLLVGGLPLDSRFQELQAEVAAFRKEIDDLRQAGLEGRSSCSEEQLQINPEVGDVKALGSSIVKLSETRLRPQDADNVKELCKTIIERLQIVGNAAYQAKSIAEAAQTCSTPLVEAARLLRSDVTAMRRELDDVRCMSERESSARGDEQAQTKQLIQGLSTRLDEIHLDFSAKSPRSKLVVDDSGSCADESTKQAELVKAVASVVGADIAAVRCEMQDACLRCEKSIDGVSKQLSDACELTERDVKKIREQVSSVEDAQKRLSDSERSRSRGRSRSASKGRHSDRKAASLPSKEHESKEAVVTKQELQIVRQSCELEFENIRRQVAEMAPLQEVEGLRRRILDFAPVHEIEALRRGMQDIISIRESAKLADQEAVRTLQKQLDDLALSPLFEHGRQHNAYHAMEEQTPAAVQEQTLTKVQESGTLADPKEVTALQKQLDDLSAKCSKHHDAYQALVEQMPATIQRLVDNVCTLKVGVDSKPELAEIVSRVTEIESKVKEFLEASGSRKENLPDVEDSYQCSEGGTQVANLPQNHEKEDMSRIEGQLSEYAQKLENLRIQVSALEANQDDAMQFETTHQDNARTLPGQCLTSETHQSCNMDIVTQPSDSQTIVHFQSLFQALEHRVNFNQSRVDELKELATSASVEAKEAMNRVREQQEAAEGCIEDLRRSTEDTRVQVLGAVSRADANLVRLDRAVSEASHRLGAVEQALPESSRSDSKEGSPEAGPPELQRLEEAAATTESRLRRRLEVIKELSKELSFTAADALLDGGKIKLGGGTSKQEVDRASSNAVADRSIDTAIGPCRIHRQAPSRCWADPEPSELEEKLDKEFVQHLHDLDKDQPSHTSDQPSKQILTRPGVVVYQGVESPRRHNWNMLHEDDDVAAKDIPYRRLGEPEVCSNYGPPTRPRSPSRLAPGRNLSSGARYLSAHKTLQTRCLQEEEQQSRTRQLSPGRTLSPSRLANSTSLSAEGDSRLPMWAPAFGFIPIAPGNPRSPCRRVRPTPQLGNSQLLMSSPSLR